MNELQCNAQFEKSPLCWNVRFFVDLRVDYSTSTLNTSGTARNGLQRDTQPRTATIIHGLSYLDIIV